MNTPTRSTARRLVAPLAAVALVLGACGGDDDGPSGSDDAAANAYADALAAEFRADPENPFTDDEADCVARQFIDIMGGPEVFEAAGVTPEDFAESESPLGDTDMEFTDEQARRFGASFSECGINFVDLFAEGMGEISDEARDCLREQLSDEVVGQMFVMLNQDDDDAVDAVVFDAIGPCIPLLAG